jgi:glycosyltransferase 2 family protein
MDEEAETALAGSERKAGGRYRGFAIRAVIGVALVAVILWFADVRPVLAVMSRERIGFFVATVALFVAGQAMSAFRWQLLAMLNGISGSYPEYLRYYFIGMFTNVFVPGLIGGDAARAIYLGRRYRRIGEAVASVIADRGIGLVALFWLAAIAAGFFDAVALPASVVRALAAVALIAALGYLVSPVIAIPMTRIRGRLAKFATPMLPYLTRPVAIIPAIVLSLLLQVSLAVCQYLLAAGLNLNIPLASFLVIVPIANAATSLPITINGLGIRETAYLILFAAAGVAKPDAVALSLLYFAATLIGGLTGIAPFLSTPMPSLEQAPIERAKVPEPSQAS